MQRTPPDEGKPRSEDGAEQEAAGPYVKPELVEYGPLAKLTQGQAGSTGEGANTTRRMCL